MPGSIRRLIIAAMLLALLDGPLPGEDAADSLADAKFYRKGDFYKTDIFDRHLFTTKNCRISYVLTPGGKRRLDKIIRVLREYPSSLMKIVGHASSFDYNNYSERKAKAISQYFLEENIAPDRITVIGAGDREVIDTYRGYRRIDRVEFILSLTR